MRERKKERKMGSDSFYLGKRNERQIDLCGREKESVKRVNV